MAYGGCITPRGKIIEVMEKCGHRELVDYTDAYTDGWVIYTNASGCLDWETNEYFGMSIRLNPFTATKAALKALLKVMAQSSQSAAYLSDTFTNDFEGLSQGLEMEKARFLIRELYEGRNPFLNSKLKRQYLKPEPERG